MLSVDLLINNVSLFPNSVGSFSVWERLAGASPGNGFRINRGNGNNYFMVRGAASDWILAPPERAGFPRTLSQSYPFYLYCQNFVTKKLTVVEKNKHF